MDQIKIGKFIAEKRKEKQLTQMQLAEKLSITDRAVSKWENGKALPDASIMLDLCALLGITVNDLLSGEEVYMENYNEKIEQNLIDTLKKKAEADKRLLKIEIVMCVVSLLFMFTLLAIGIVFMNMGQPKWVFFLMLGVGIVQCVIVAFIGVRIEQVAGYYECAKCGHKYVPTYLQANLAMHIGRTRYMKCPHCGKRSWQKKVIDKDE